MTSVVVRRIQPDEWPRLRALRLAALADAPMAFGSTLAGEQAFSDQVWRDRAATGAAGQERATMVADDAGRWVGLATGLLSSEGGGEQPAWVVGMWVHPDARGRGVARSLLRAVAAWARERGADVLNLDVTETNAAAIALYERLGFRASGESAPLPHTPAMREQHMQCRLADTHAW